MRINGSNNIRCIPTPSKSFIINAVEKTNEIQNSFKEQLNQAVKQDKASDKTNKICWKRVNTHFYKKDETGQIDTWAWDRDFHNGPICELCGKTPCVHCEPNWLNLTCSYIHYKCPVCGFEVERTSNYCPDCGMRLYKEEQLYVERI